MANARRGKVIKVKCPTCKLSLLIKPGCGMQRYIDAVPAQHINIVYGDQTHAVKEFCKFTGIDVVEG